MLIFMGDFNAKLENKKNAYTTGGNGLGNMNERGERLIEWCCEKGLCITNTWFAKPEKKL